MERYVLAIDVGVVFAFGTMHVQIPYILQNNIDKP